MSDENTISYPCQECGYQNNWTRDQILQKGKKTTFLGEEDEDLYSLPCQNPRLDCHGRRRIAVKREV